MSALTEAATAAWEWPATGTTWRIHHSGGVTGALAATVARAVERDEARWSRFRPDSEVSRINAAGGSWVTVSADTLYLLEACVTWAERTDGVFQPLVGGVLVAWGYRRSLLDVDAFAASSPSPGRLDGRIEIDCGHATIRIPRGTRLDLGGIAKSWMAGRAAALLCARCDDHAMMVDAGGDLVAARDNAFGKEKSGGQIEVLPWAWDDGTGGCASFANPSFMPRQAGIPGARTGYFYGGVVAPGGLLDTTTFTVN